MQEAAGARGTSSSPHGISLTFEEVEVEGYGPFKQQQVGPQEAARKEGAREGPVSIIMGIREGAGSGWASPRHNPTHPLPP